AEQAPRRHDETLGAAGEPGQRAERERDEPAELPGSHRHAYRVQAADSEARRGAETGGGKRPNERADLGWQLRVAEDVGGCKGTGADERPLGQGGNARKADAKSEPGRGERKVGAGGERVGGDQPSEHEGSEEGRGDDDSACGCGFGPSLASARE